MMMMMVMMIIIIIKYDFCKNNLQIDRKNGIDIQIVDLLY